MAANPKRKQEIITLIVVFAVVVLASALAAYYIGGGGRPTTTTPPPSLHARKQMTLRRRSLGSRRHNEPDTRAPQRTTASSIECLDLTPRRIRSAPTLAETMGRISVRFLLAALLGAALAFRPRKRILAFKRNPYVSQTQILLAIVAAALMIVVGDNAARAFGIFAPCHSSASAPTFAIRKRSRYC